MNSHIVEKTMHSIKNIDRLTDLAAIDVYNTTHDTINKYEIMKEHATEEYTNESFYQESVLAGVLIGAGILGVAVSAFFIIKKIIDSKSKVTTKNSDGSTSVAVDLSDPKSTEKFITKLKERASKLNADTKVTTSQSINPEAAEEEINLLEGVVEAFQNIIDSKDDTAKIKEILKGLKTDTNFDELTNKAFVSGDKEITLGNYVEELGISEMVNFSKKINELKTKCDKAEKTINGMKANKETDSSTEGITDAEIKSLKDFSTLVAKALDSMLNKSNAICSSANTILDQAEEDAKKPKEEAKPETSEAKKKDEGAKPTNGTGSDTPQNANPQAQPSETSTPVAQNSVQHMPPSSTPLNIDFQASGFNGENSAPAVNPQVAATGGETQTPVSGTQPVESNLGINFLNAAAEAEKQAKGNENKDQDNPPTPPIKKDENTDSKITYKPLGVPNEYGASLIVSVSDKSAENVVRPYLEYAKTNNPSDTTKPLTIDINNNNEVKEFNRRLNILLDMEKTLMDNLEFYAPTGKIKPETVQTYLELLNVLRTELIDKFTDWNVSNDVINNAKKLIENVNKRYESFIKIINTETTEAKSENENEEKSQPTASEKENNADTQTEESKTEENKNLEDDKIKDLSNTIYGNQSPEKKAAIASMLTDLRNGEAKTIEALNMFKEVLNDNISKGKKDIKAAQNDMTDRVTSYELIADEFGINADYLKSYDATIPTEAKSENGNKEKSQPTDRNDNAVQVTYGDNGEIIINGKNTGIKKNWSDDMNERAEKMISYLENDYNNPAKIAKNIFAEAPSGDIAARLDSNYQYWINKVKDGKATPEEATEGTDNWREMLLNLARALGEDENLPPVPDFKALVPSENNADTEPEKKPEDQVKTEPENSPAPTDQNTGENTQETTSENSESIDDRTIIDMIKKTFKAEPDTTDEELLKMHIYAVPDDKLKEYMSIAREELAKEQSSEPETKPEGEDKNSSVAEGTENSGEKKWTVSKIIELAKTGSDKAFELLSAINNDAIENDVVPKKTFETYLMDTSAVMALPMDYKTRLLATFESNNSLLGTVKSIINEIKNGDRSAVNKLKNININNELTTGNDVSDYITSILPRVKSVFDSLVNKYKPEMLKGVSQIETRVLNIEQNVVTFFNFIKDACKGLVNKDKALNKVNDMESLVGQLLGKLDPNFSYGDAYSQNEFGNNNTENKPDPFARQRKQGTATAPAQFNPSAPQEWNDNMNALKSAGAENISQKTEVPPISPIDTNADIEKAKAEKAQLDALQQHRQEQLAQLKAERDQREQQVRNAYAQDAQARQNALDEELAKQSQEDEQKKAQAEELTKANEDANVAEAIRQAEEEKKALEEGKNLSVSPQSTEGLDNAAKAVAMQDFIKNFKDPAWREAHPGIVTWQDLYNSDGYKNEAIMKVEADRIKNEKLAENRAGIQFIKEQNYEAIVPSLNKVIETTPDAKTITRYLDGLKTAYAKILMQYQQNPGNARKIIEDYSKDGAAPYEFYAVPYNELNQTQLVDWQQRLFNEKVELDKDRRRNRKKIKAVDKIIDKLIELDELLKTSVHNVIAAATKNPMRALEAALVMFQEGDEEIIAGLTAIENFINKADEVKASEEEADKTPENPAEEPSDEEVSQSILSILKS